MESSLFPPAIIRRHALGRAARLNMEKVVLPAMVTDSRKALLEEHPDHQRQISFLITSDEVRSICRWYKHVFVDCAYG